MFRRSARYYCSISFSILNYANIFAIYLFGDMFGQPVSVLKSMSIAISKFEDPWVFAVFLILCICEYRRYSYIRLGAVS